MNFGKVDGLIPAIVQHAETRDVLMLGYMNEDALAATKASGLVTFYSRTRQALWTKGETSGNVLRVVELIADCDNDALLVRALPEGPTCHRGSASCFDATGYAFLAELGDTIEARFASPPEGSYVGKLITAGLPRMAQKVGEEGVETVIAALGDDVAALEGEAADLVFHLLVLLRARGTSLARVVATLEARHRERTAK
jgi:phosphoribosyl-ATP pyrophosphohydrolase/phosphoribosyl-AMP cyclohydrolase